MITMNRKSFNSTLINTMIHKNNTYHKKDVAIMIIIASVQDPEIVMQETLIALIHLEKKGF
jgi:hypothetical protein